MQTTRLGLHILTFRFGEARPECVNDIETPERKHLVSKQWSFL